MREYSFPLIEVYNRIHFHTVHTVIHNFRYGTSVFSELSTVLNDVHMRYIRLEYAVYNSYSKAKIATDSA